MIWLFAALAILIVISAVLTSGKGLFLGSPNKDIVYELRIKNGNLEHALRHGGAQVLKWAPLTLAGEGVEISEIRVEQADHAKHEYVVSGFSQEIKLDVKVENTGVFFRFINVPAGEFREDIRIIPEEKSAFCRLTHKNANGAAPAKTLAGTIAPKAKGLCYISMDISDAPEKISPTENSFELKFENEYSLVEERSALRTHAIYVSDKTDVFESIKRENVPAISTK